MGTHSHRCHSLFDWTHLLEHGSSAEITVITLLDMRNPPKPKRHIYTQLKAAYPAAKILFVIANMHSAAYPHTFSPWNTIPRGKQALLRSFFAKALASVVAARTFSNDSPAWHEGPPDLGKALKGELKGESVKDRSAVKISQSHGPASFLNVPLSLTVCIQPERQRSWFSASSSPAQWCQWTPSWVLISSKTTRTHMTS